MTLGTPLLAFNVAPVVVLIGHDHKMAVAKTLRVGVHVVKLETHDLHQILGAAGDCTSYTSYHSTIRTIEG